MSITDELRDYIKEQQWCAKGMLTAIADRIDAAHEEAIQREHESAYYAGYDEGFASADDALSREENGVLEEHGFVRMPKGADGKYWFCGDKIMLPDGNVVEIIGIGGDWLYYCVASVAITVFGRIRAHDKRHYHVPTVEDVLREFARECLTYATCVEDHEVTDAIELYAPKLRLAGAGE